MTMENKDWCMGLLNTFYRKAEFRLDGAVFRYSVIAAKRLEEVVGSATKSLRGMNLGCMIAGFVIRDLYQEVKSFWKASVSPPSHVTFISVLALKSPEMFNLAIDETKFTPRVISSYVTENPTCF